MANINFITDRLATGGDLTSVQDLDDLVEAGITHIIDNRMEWSDEDFVSEHAPHITYLHVGVDDAGGQQPTDWYRQGVTFALEALQDPEAKVLSHCHMGINRGPSMAFAILLAQGWDPVDAFDAIRAARPIAGIIYARDALANHLATIAAPASETRAAIERLARHEEARQIDIAGIIRRIRVLEAEGLAG